MKFKTPLFILMLSCASCLVGPHREPWAPLLLKLDPSIANPDTGAFVYVDGVYRGNTLEGRFSIYLTLEPHDVRVNVTGFEAWERNVSLSNAEYPKGRTILVTPIREEAASNHLIHPYLQRGRDS